MPYLALDLDAKRKCGMIARAIGLSPGEVCWGLLELWEFAWREKRSQVNGIELRACVGSHGELTAALEQFGFLESNAEGWRVKGADRYLVIREAQSEAGKKHAGNLKRGAEKPARLAGESRGSEEEPSRVSPGSTSGSTREAFPALTPSTEHRAPKERISAPVKPPRQPSTAESLFGWWQDRRAESKLDTEAPPKPGRLNTALKPLLEHFGRPELERRYRTYLGDAKYRDKDPPWAWQVFVAVAPTLKPAAETPAVRVVKPGEDLYAS